MEGRGSILWKEQIFLFSAPRLALGAVLAFYLIFIGGTILGVKQLRREADHTSLSSVEVKKGGLPLRFHGLGLN